MKSKLSLLIVLFICSCPCLVAQRRGREVEVKVADMKATPAGISVTLRASDSQDSIRMMIGFSDAQSLARAMHPEKDDRPMSHDLFKTFLERNGWRVQKVLIRDVDMKEGTFMADLTVENDHESQVYDARPSDAMAIGLRFGAKIYVNQNVFDKQREGQGEEEKSEEPSQPEQLKL